MVRSWQCMPRKARYIVLVATLWLCAQSLFWHHLYTHTHDADTACSVCHVATHHGNVLAAEDHFVFEVSRQRFDVSRPIDVAPSPNPQTYLARAPPV